MLVSFLLLSISVLYLRLCDAQPFSGWSSLDIIPAAVADSASTVFFTSAAYGLDSPKVYPLNSTTWDWWYFDMVSPDQQYSVSVVFFAVTENGFYTVSTPDNASTLANMYLSVPGSETFTSFDFPATEAVVTSIGNGATGLWQDGGAAFVGAADMSTYTIVIDSPINAVQGEIKMQSLAPAHYPCGPAQANETMLIMPSVCWANAVPDAVATFDFIVNGTEVKFSGAGYHDKNWGDSPFIDNVGSWYWGHGHLGPYSLVWYDALGPDGVEYVSGYVAVDGRILAVSCSTSEVSVRPTGVNDTYPPTSDSPPPSSFHIHFDMGEEGIMEVEATLTFRTVEVNTYYRSVGSLEGGIQGQEVYSGGTALWEEFALLS